RGWQSPRPLARSPRSSLSSPGSACSGVLGRYAKCLPFKATGRPTSWPRPMQPNLPIRLAEAVLVGLVAACGGENGARSTAAPATSAAAPDQSQPADSLALRTPSGGELWFTLAREERDGSGAPCVERTLEIR